MYKLFIGIRYLWRNWLNFVGMLAVLIAVMVPIVVLSVMKGFGQQLREGTRATLSDIILEPYSNDPFDGYEQLVTRIEALPHVTSAAPQFAGLGLLNIDKQTVYVQYIGIDLDRELATSDLGGYYRAARAEVARDELRSVVAHLESPSELIDKETIEEIASRLRKYDLVTMPGHERKKFRASAAAHGVDLEAHFKLAEEATPTWIEVDDPKKQAPVLLGSQLSVLAENALNIVLIIPTTIQDERRTFQRCQVGGYIKSGISDYDQRIVLLPLEAIQRRHDKPGHATQINIRLDDFANAIKVRAMLCGVLTPEELEDGFDLLGPVLRATAPMRFKQAQADLTFLLQQAATARSDQISRRSAELEANLLKAAEQALSAARNSSNPPGGGISPEDMPRLRAFIRLCLERYQNAIAPALYLDNTTHADKRGFRVSTWEDKRRNFLRAIQVEQRLLAFIMFFVTIVAGFLIFAILHTTVLVKTKDIGIIKSIGGNVSGIMSLFLMNGVVIAIVGAICGCVSGLLILRYINEIETLLSALFGFKLFPREIYLFDRMPVDKDPLPEAIVIALAAIVTSFIASALPAWKASRKDPVEALRYE